MAFRQIINGAAVDKNAVNQDILDSELNTIQLELNQVESNLSLKADLSNGKVVSTQLSQINELSSTNIFLAVPFWSPAVVTYSTNLVSWQNVSLPFPATGNPVYGNGRFVIGSNTYILVSTNATTWSLASAGSVSWGRAVFGNGIYLLQAQYSSSSLTYSTNGTSWLTSTLPTTGGIFSNLTFINNLFWATGNPQTSAYSTNGITWTTTTLPNSLAWSTTSYGNGTYISLAGSTIARSTDGTTWSLGSIPFANWLASTFANGRFVAVSNGTTATYSTDGITWLTSTLPANRYWNSLTFANNVFVASAEYDDNFATTSSAATSTDGITWTSVTLPSSRNWLGISGGVAQISADNQIASRAYVDTSVSSLIDAAPAALDTLNELAAALNDDSSFATTVTNAIAGKADTSYVDAQIANISLDGVATPTYLAVSQNKIMTIKNNTVINQPYTVTGLSSGQTIGAFGSGRFVLADQYSSQIVTSSDAVNWSTVSIPIEPNDIVYGKDRFVAIPYNGRPIYSTNGINWLQSSAPSNLPGEAIAHGSWNVFNPTDNTITYKNLFVTVAWGTGGAYSTDGISWTATTIPNGSWYSIEFGNDRFVAVPYNTGFSMFSTDGLTWTTTQAPATARSTQALSYGNGYFVTPSGQNNNSNLYASTDGSTWTTIELPFSGRSNEYWTSSANGSMGLLVGGYSYTSGIDGSGYYPTYAFSTNGLVWQNLTLPAEQKMFEPSSIIFGYTYENNVNLVDKLNDIYKLLYKER